MPIDRNDALRRAEKLLRQGRLDAAVSAYTAIVDEFPHDLVTGNLLGDLHLRAGQIDRAVAQYTRIAERLVHEGFLPRAAALYKKIIKIKPDDDTALSRSADLALKQGLSGEARVYLAALYQARLRRGDREGAADAAIRRVAADAGDVSGHMDAARLLAGLGQTAAAAEQWRAAASVLHEHGRRDEARRALADALELEPDHGPTRDRFVDALLESGALEEAAGAATTAPQFGRVARAILAAGDAEAAAACLTRAASAHPRDAAIRVELARLELLRGRVEDALAALPAPDASEPPDLALLRVEALARSGHAAEARATIERLVQADRSSLDAAAQVCLALAEFDGDAAFSCLEPVVNVVRRSGDLMGVRGVVQRMAAVSRDPIEALRLLIDICDDLADEDGVYHAQVELTERLLKAGRFAEARVLAELLVAKRPDVAVHSERLQEATAGLAPSLVGGDAAEMSVSRALDLATLLDTGLAADTADAGDAAFEFRLEDEPPADAASPDGSLPEGVEPAEWDLTAPEGPDDVVPCQPGAAAGDAAGGSEREAVEIDLSDALNGLLAPVLPAGGAPLQDPAQEPADLEGYFQGLREASGAGERTMDAARAFDAASLAYNEGRQDEARRHLEQAARDPAFRFRAAAMLARLARDAGRLRETIEWLERAAEAPAPSAGAWDALLYDLASTLHQTGEASRALAVFMELQSASPGYRDVDEWIAALSSLGATPGRHDQERSGE